MSVAAKSLSAVITRGSLAYFYQEQDTMDSVKLGASLGLSTFVVDKFDSSLSSIKGGLNMLGTWRDDVLSSLISSLINIYGLGMEDSGVKGLGWSMLYNMVSLILAGYLVNPLTPLFNKIGVE